MDSFAYLIKRDMVQDEIGQFIPGGETRLEIFVTEKSVTRSEFFNAGSTGLRPDYVFETAAINYNNESEIEYNGIVYSIYRTFKASDGDMIELYVTKKAGAV